MLLLLTEGTVHLELEAGNGSLCGVCPNCAIAHGVCSSKRRSHFCQKLFCIRVICRGFSLPSMLQKT